MAKERGKRKRTGDEGFFEDRGREEKERERKGEDDGAAPDSTRLLPWLRPRDGKKEKIRSVIKRRTI